MKKYEIIKKVTEIKYKDREKIVEGCTLNNDPNPETVKSCDTKEEALESLKNYKTDVTYMQGHVYSYYIVTEYYVEENEYDENGDWLDGGDIWAITEMVPFEE